MKRLYQQYKNIIYILILCGLSYVTGLSLAMVSGYGVTGIDILNPCLIVFAGVVYHRAAAILSGKTMNDGAAASGKTMKDTAAVPFGKNIKYAAPMGFIFALTLVVGSKIEIYEGIFQDLSITDIVVWPFLGVFFTAVIILLFHFTDESKKNTTDISVKTKSKPDSKLFLGLFLLYLVCYLPYFLTFFPGNCGNDTWESVRMALGEIPWTNHHPALFTGLIMLVIKATPFLSLTGSIGVFSFLQMTSLSAVLAYVSVRIIKMRVHTLCKLFTVAMFALHPFMGMYSIYLTKDVLFAEIMILLCLKVYDVIALNGTSLEKASECVKLSVLFLLSCMLRNNGQYIAIVMAVIFLFLYKKYWKQIVLLFICAIRLFQIWQGPVFSAMGIEKQSFAEAASVPLQQIGYVLWEGNTFSEEDMAFLEELMPIEKVKEVYQPGYTDPYKFDEAFNDAFLNENVGRFLEVWWNGCKEHFGSYVKAYLMQTVGYWHYGETNSVCTQGIVQNTVGVEQIDVIKNTVGISLEPLFEQMVLAGRKAPIACVLSSMAMQMVMVFLLTLQYLRRKNGRQAIWLIPLVILWGTIMVATPAFCLLRYLFPIFLLWPVMIAEFLAV